MIESLEISNLAIIAKAELTFSDGFTVITGETGAGKTVLLNSLSLLQGDTSVDTMIREGADKAKVEACFTNVNIPFGDERLSEIIISRELIRGKSSICRINGHRVPLKTLKSLKSKLFHSVRQHEGQSLNSTDYQRKLLDHYGESLLDTNKKRYKEIYKTYINCLNKLKELETTEKDQDQLIEFLSFQIDDIKKQNFKETEEIELKQIKKTVKSKEKLQKLKQINTNSFAILNQELSKFEKTFQELTEIDNTLNPLFDQIQSIQINLEDLQSTFEEKSKKWNTITHESLDDIEMRLDSIFRYKNKYKVQTVPQLLEHLKKTEEKLRNITHHTEEKERLNAELIKHKEKLSTHGKALYEIRKSVAKKLSQEIEIELKQLNFQEPKINIKLSYSKETIHAEGQDELQFLITSNIGFSPLPLEKIASGGERSRILLVLQSILQDPEQTGTLIFDEIDTGIGGMTAHKLATKLQKIATHQQVITITHLPQIAEKASHHFQLKKGVSEQKTTTNIHLLSNNQERETELQRMAGKTN